MKIAYFYTTVFFFMLAGILGVQAQPTSKEYQSLLWEISHPTKTKEVSYLYGTMHVSKKLAFNLSDTFFIGLNNADIVALETEPTDWMEEVMDLRYATEYFGNYPMWSGSYKGFYQRMYSLSPPNNEQIGELISSRDLMLNSLQYRNNPYMLDFEEDTYLDMFIYMSGKRMEKHVVGLENIAQTNDFHRIARSEVLTKKDRKPIPVWLEERMKEQDLGTIFENSYRQQDLDLMMELLSLFQTDHYTHWFLNERNRLMADSMEVLMANNRVFAGVGAAHLAGEKGMINYLRNKGFTVRPVGFLKTDYATDEKKRLDSLSTDLNLTEQISPDNQFVISLPAKLYELPYSGKHLLCSEMVNGSFFSVQKINTFDLVSGLTPNAYLAKVDSLLFENIPGTILSKEKIKKGPYSGWEIKNRTKTGNLQHYQIYATPFEVLVMKMGGNGDFIENWSDSVFGTLRFTADFSKDTEWKEQTYVYGGFQVTLPSIQLLDNNTSISAVYNHPVFQGFDPKTSNQYLVTRSVLNDFFYLEEDEFELDRAADKLGKRLKKEVSCKNIGSHDGLPCIDFVLSEKEGKKDKNKVSYRLIIQGPYYYLLAANTHSNDTELTRFIKSFKVVPFEYNKPFETYTDTFLHFSVQTALEINESKIRKPSSSEKPKDYEEVKESYIYMAESGERIRVFFNKHHQYTYYPSVDSLFEEDIRDIVEDNNQYVISKKRADTDQLYIQDVLLGDTGTTRAIKLRIVAKKTGDTKYTIRTMVDTLMPVSPFVEQFYNTFQPSDSVLSLSIFEPKGDLFLNDLFSTEQDSFQKALSSLSYVKLTEKDVDRVKGILNEYPFEEEDKEFIRALLLEELRYVKDPRLIEIAKSLYFDNPNYYPIQMAALAIICAQKNQEAVEALTYIMSQDLPYVMDGDKYLLSPLRRDSMELWKQLYPQMFEFDHIPEYKALILSDLEDMLKAGFIEPDFYEAYLVKLLEEAEFILKKNMAKEQKKELEDAQSMATDEKKSSFGVGEKNHALLQKYRLLLPHSNQEQVKQLIERFDQNIQTYANRIQMIQYKLKNEMEVDEKQIIELASKPDVLLELFLALQAIDKEKLIPAQYRPNELIAKLILNEGATGSYYWGVRYDYDKDTFSMLKQEITHVRGKAYKVYYFKINQFISSSDAQKSNFVAKDFQRLALIAIELKEGELNLNGRRYKTTVKIENPEREEKYIEEMTQEFIVKDRPRASSRDLGDNYGYWDY